MSFSHWRSTFLVGLALAALLAAPGIAEPQRRVPIQVGEDAGSCRVDDGPAAAAPMLTAEQLRAIKARMQAAVVAEGSAGGIIPLNGRGYNYRAANDPTRELLLIQRELESNR